MKKRIQAFFNPEQFHGWGKTKNYFEGWYFKVINEAETKVFAFIPGVTMDKDGNQHSLIQVLNGKEKTAVYHKFSIKDFSAEPGRFLISLSKNKFSANQIDIDLPGITGQLNFSENIPWPNKIYSPGIMGSFAFVPFMNCFHSVVSLDNRIIGKLTINNEIVDFTNGRGYIEKDWGRSFPEAFVWMQSNHFNEPGVSLKVTVAKVPWLLKSFTGFIGGLWLRNKLYKFTSYNSSSLRKFSITKRYVQLVMENKNYRIEIVAYRDKETTIASPIGGLLDGSIEESMAVEVEVRLSNKKDGQIIFEGIGRNMGLEAAGKVDELMLG